MENPRQIMDSWFLSSSRKENGDYGGMELTSSRRKKAMAFLKTTKRRKRKVKVTAQGFVSLGLQLGPLLTYLFGTTIQIRIARMGANLYFHLLPDSSLGPAFNGPTLPGLINHTLSRPTQPIPHTWSYMVIQAVHFTPGRFPPEESPNKKKMEHTSKVINPTAKHAEEGSGKVPCKKEASWVQEDQMAVEGKGLKLKQKRHTKERWWILNPHLKPSKFR